MLMSKDNDIRDGKFERIDGVAILLVQGPSDLGVQRFHWGLSLFCNVPHD